jgi:hypothetical protein
MRCILDNKEMRSAFTINKVRNKSTKCKASEFDIKNCIKSTLMIKEVYHLELLKRVSQEFTVAQLVNNTIAYMYLNNIKYDFTNAEDNVNSDKVLEDFIYLNYNTIVENSVIKIQDLKLNINYNKMIRVSFNVSELIHHMLLTDSRYTTILQEISYILIKYNLYNDFTFLNNVKQDVYLKELENKYLVQ